MTGQTIRARRAANAPAALMFAAMRKSTHVQQAAVLGFFAIQVVAVTLLQKFSIDIGFQFAGRYVDFGRVEVALPIFYLSLAGFLVFLPIKIDFFRVAALGVALIFTLISIQLLGTNYSANSILLIVAMYVPFILYVEVNEKTHHAALKIFLNVMIGFSAIVFVQQVVQIVASPQLWPNMDRIIGEDYRVPGYVYIQPIRYGMRLMKPNGVFFLEVSLLSQWIAIALALELVYFQRLWRLVFYTLALLACFAGTGILLILLCAPLLLGRLSLRTTGTVMVVILIGIVFSLKIHWLDNVQQRLGEYQTQGASANHRFIEPAKILIDLTTRSDALFEGSGPGSGQKTEQAMWWASTKLAFEYGFATAFAFVAYIGVLLFHKAPSKRIAFTMFVFFNIMGGIIIPAYAIMLFIIGGLVRIRDDTGRVRPRRLNEAASAS